MPTGVEETIRKLECKADGSHAEAVERIHRNARNQEKIVEVEMEVEVDAKMLLGRVAWRTSSRLIMIKKMDEVEAKVA